MMFKMNFKDFKDSPLIYIMFVLLLGIVWIGNVFINSKDKELDVAYKRIEDCDKERKLDKILLQEIIFETKIKNKIKKDDS